MNTITKQSVDKFINGFFEVFDNRVNKLPNFSQLEKMFHTDAIITKFDGHQINTMTVTEFIQPRAQLFTDGSLRNFHEWEKHSHTTINHMIANRVSHYQKYGELNGNTYKGQGIKYFQLLMYKNHWKIISILWQDDD